ncbi:hypothetical protein [Ruegeria sp.]|uniref:hypothetical protein n=1 Tax=Ruegeria sp. TaxID=1879320 RepID=UPI003B000D11
MAHALQIDTLAFSKKLREAGADEKLAEAIVEGLTAADTSELATKGDLAEAEAAMKADIAEVRSDLKADVAALQADIAEVRSDLKWMKGIGGAILAVLILPWLADLAGVVIH